MRRGERLTLLAIAAVSAALRAAAFFRYRFDSDEAQHLHVAWGWTAGLLQYRDLFDNHAPLFHILTAPLLAAVGERPDVLLYMRAPMLLPFAIVLATTWILGTRLYSLRVGVWSALLLSLVPTFFLKSLEYRTDNLWNAWWCLTLVVLTGGELTFVRMFCGGLLMGLAFATSMKTSLLVLTLAAAALMTSIAYPKRQPRAAVLHFLAGMVIAPAAIVAYFARQGALSKLVYCVVEFNGLLMRMRPAYAIWIPRALWLAAIAVTIRVAWRYRERTTPSRFFIAFGTAFFFVTLFGFWILISPRDFLPGLPLLAIFFVAYVERKSQAPVLVYAIASLMGGVVIAQSADGFRNHTLEHITMMRQVLGLTRAGEPIMDYKGETIYRPRPFYYAFEFITRNALHRGLIEDTIPEDIIRTRCHVAQADGDFFPPRGKEFMHANFVDVGRLRVAGKWIKSGQPFSLPVPGDYVVINKRGLAYAGSIGAGSHTFTTADSDAIACLWAPAFQRGYSPFVLRDRDF